MIHRHICFACALLFALAAVSRADIFRWDNGALIPGTQGITPGPGVQLSNRNLDYADLSQWDTSSSNNTAMNLTGAQFNSSNLIKARFDHAVLTNAALRGANLVDSDFSYAVLNNADLSGAIVAGAKFGYTTSRGFTKEQLYQTASYETKDLQGIGLWENDLSGWDFGEQNLANANFEESRLSGASFANANVKGATFANFSQSISQEQLYSTASYQEKDLQGIRFVDNSLTGWNFSGQNLSGALFVLTTLTNADFSGAVVAGAHFGGSNLTKEQLYSTASYQAKNLRGINFGGYFPRLLHEGNDLTGWDFSGQDLRDSFIDTRETEGPNLTGADVRGAFWIGQMGTHTRNTILPDGTVTGLELTAGESLLIRDDDGVLQPRLPIPVLIQDGFAMVEDSILQLLLDADPWDSLIAFEPGIPVQLGGTLDLTFADDVHLATQVDRTLRLFDWTGVSPSGQFAIRSPYVWDVTNLYTTGQVTLLAVPEPSALGLMGVACMRLVATRRKRGRLAGGGDA
jgi:uncharacterized protein YjbI with pentapeptide repeats